MVDPDSRETLPDACAARLRQMILRGDFQPGERLPAERPLAEDFDVNRVTLRSALSRLTDSGLLQVRQGRGYVVADYRVTGGPELLPGLFAMAEDGEALAELANDLFLVRRQLARAVLGRVRERRPSCEGVEAAIRIFGDAVSAGAGPSELAEADADVLVALLDTTGSAVLQLTLNPVRAVLRDLPALTAFMYRAPEQNLEAWHALLAWMRAPEETGVETLVAMLEARDAATVAAMEKA